MSEPWPHLRLFGSLKLRFVVRKLARSTQGMFLLFTFFFYGCEGWMALSCLALRVDWIFFLSCFAAASNQLGLYRVRSWIFFALCFEIGTKSFIVEIECDIKGKHSNNLPLSVSAFNECSWPDGRSSNERRWSSSIHAPCAAFAHVTTFCSLGMLLRRDSCALQRKAKHMQRRCQEREKHKRTKLHVHYDIENGSWVCTPGVRSTIALFSFGRW